MKNLKHLPYCLLWATVALSACGGNRSASETATTTHESHSAVAALTAFDADSAYRFVAEQVEFGPRVPGTEAHRRCGDYIASKLRGYGADVTVTDTVFVAIDGKSTPVRNIMGRFRPEAKRSVMLLAHYDTRPWADRDANPSNHSLPIDGANDGGSGVAVMLEIARNISGIPADLGIDMLFVDAEDAGSYAEDATWCIGSQAWASYRNPADRCPSFAILLDMVGGKDAVFHREYFSELSAKGINDRVWAAARALGYGSRFVDAMGGAINDDHLNIQAAGIPAIDIIESYNPSTEGFNPTWHTLDDNLSNIAPTTMAIVGRVVMKALQ